MATDGRARDGLTARIVRTLRALQRAERSMAEPAVEKISEETAEDPFRVLIATMLSAQTKDAVTAEASARLFRVARSPRTMAALPVATIQRLIYPVSFYRVKARHVKAACRQILERFGGRVPGRMEDLLTLPGVGRKTANLVLILSHASRDNICVDTHVHRIANRLGWVRTKTPDQTEQALYRVVPRRFWPKVNLYLVTWGQNVCRPVYPRCPACVISPECGQVGVKDPRRLFDESKRRRGSFLLLALALAVLPAAAPQAPPPVAVFETVKGPFEVTFLPGDAPKSVAHLVGLLEKRFYRGQRITRVSASLVQFGDPQSRNMTLQARWGSGGSGTRIGVAEFSKRTHARGIVALAHPGNAAAADSQMFILKVAVPSYDGKYTIVGRVTSGMDVVDRLAVADLIRQATIKAAGPPF